MQRVGGGIGAKCVGEWRVGRLFRIHELVRMSLRVSTGQQ